MTRLILIRHGETNWNVDRRKQGRNDQPLNEKGAAQAKLAAEHVKANYDIKKVWSSPLQRCSDTAALFNIEVATSDHLLEIDYGEWEGMLTTDIEENARPCPKRSWHECQCCECFGPASSCRRARPLSGTG